MGENDAVNIRIDFEASTDKLTDAVDASISDIKSHLETLKKKIDESLAPDNRKDIFKRNIASIEDMVQKVQLLLLYTKDTTEQAKGLSQAVSQMGRVMKGQNVKGYEGTTAKEFAETKKEAAATKQEVRSLNEELSRTANEMGKEALQVFRAINESLQIGRRPGATRKDQSAEILKENIALLEKYGEVAGETFDPTKPETYASKLKAIKDIESEIERYYNTGKQEKWGDRVVDTRVGLIREELELIDKISRESTDVQHTEETLNEIKRVNLTLEQQRANAKYQLLEIEKNIADVEQKRMYNGEVLTKEQWKSLQESRNFLRERVKMFDRQLQQNKIISKSVEDSLNADRQETEEKQKQAEAEKERVAAINSAIRAEQENMKQAKLTTSQYYYRLRSMKMVNRYLGIAKSAINGFGKKAIGEFGNATKSITKFISKLKIFKLNLKDLNIHLNKHTKGINTAKKAHDNWNVSLGKGIKMVLKYVFGIRSLYVLFNKLRGAIGEGMLNLATQWSDVNGQMSSIVTNIFQMKNALAAMAQPILNVFVPAMDRLAESVTNVTTKIASFFAALAGQEYIYKAKEVQQEYVESLKDTEEETEEMNGQLQSYDKLLNVTTKDEKKDDKKNPVADMFEKVPIDSKMADWVKKLKDLLSKLFAPIKAAWDKEGKFVMDAWKYALNEIWKLIKDIGRDFMRVWQEPETQRIFENILHILGDIGLIVGNLAKNFRKAWNENENGYRILKAIRDIILIITEGVRELADYAVIWSEKLNFVPFMNALREVLEKQVVPAVQKMVDLFVLLGKAVLELVRYFIEELLPILLHIAGYLVEAIGNIAEGIRKVLENGDDLFDENDRLYRLLQSIEGIVTIIAKGLLDCAKATADWAKELNFEPLFAEFEKLLSKIKDMTQKVVNLFVYLYREILLKIVKDFIEKGLPQIERIIGYIADTIGNISENLHKALEENGRGVSIIEHVEALIQIIADKVESCAEQTAKWSENLDFAPLLESIDEYLTDIQPLVQFISDTLGKLWNDVLLPFIEYMIEEGLPKLLETLGEISNKIDWDALKEKVDAFLESFESFLEKAWETLVIVLGDLGDAIAKFINSDTFDKIVDTLIKWMDNADPNKMAEGLEKLVIHFFELQLALNFASVIGGFKEFVMTLINWHNNRALVTTVKNSTDSINNLKSALNSGSTATATNSANGLAAGVQSISTSAANTGPASLIAIAAIAAITAVTVTLWTTNEEFRNDIKGIWDEVAQSISESSQRILDSINALGFNFESLKDVWIGLCNALGPAVTAVFQAIASVVEGFTTALSGSVEFLSGIIGLIQGVVQVIVGIFHHSNEEISTGTQTLKDSIGRTFEGIGVLTDGFNQTQNAKYDAMATEISGYGEMIYENATSKATDTKDSITTTTDELSAGLSERSSEISSNVVTTSDEINDYSTSKATETKDSMLTTMDELNTESTVKMDELKLAANTTSDELAVSGQNAGTGWSNGLITALRAGIELATGDFIGFIATVREIFDEHSPSKVFDEIGQFLVEGLFQGFGLKWTEFIESSKLQATEFISAINEIFGIIAGNEDSESKSGGSTSQVFYDMGMYIVQSLKDGFDITWPEFTELVETSATEMFDYIYDLLGVTNPDNKVSQVFYDFSEGIVIGMIEGFDETWPEFEDTVEESLENLIALVEDTFEINGSISNVTYEVGIYIVDGFIQGIVYEWPELERLIEDYIEDLKQEIESMFGIASPSKFTMEIGEYLDKGLSIGIKDNSNGILKSAKTMALDTIDTISETLDDRPDMEFEFNFDSMLYGLEQIVDELTIIAKSYDTINKLSNNLSSQFNSLPDIASGKLLPTKISVLKSTENKDAISSDEMYTIVNDAVFSALNTAYKSGYFDNNPEIITQIDGKEIMKSVKRENDIYRKSTGRSYF